MANTLLTPSIIARELLATLYAQAHMAALVWRDFDADFNGQVGDTITVRKPATFTANEFTPGTPITLQDATETSVTVVLNKIPDVSFAVTVKELSLELADFSRQFLQPAAEAINQYIDTLLLAERTNITANVGTDTITPTDPKLLVDVAKLLNDANVPQSRRYAVLSNAATAEFLKDALFHQADQRGDTEGLREASIGRKFGFDVFSSSNITDGDSIAFHETAFVLASRVPAAPMGLPSAQYSTVSYNGLGLRVTQAYDINLKQDVISVDMLCGAKTMDANRAVEILG